MTEATFNWRMMKTICTELHIYDEEANYKPFDSVQVTSADHVRKYACCLGSAQHCLVVVKLVVVKPAVCCLPAHLWLRCAAPGRLLLHRAAESLVPSSVLIFFCLVMCRGTSTHCSSCSASTCRQPTQRHPERRQQLDS